MSSSTILVTGAFGNIGSHVVSALLERGGTPICFDAKSKQTRKTAKRFPSCKTVWGDIRDVASIDAAFDVGRDSGGIDVVIHLAAIIPPHSEVNPELARAINVLGTRNLLSALGRVRKCKRIVLASSIASMAFVPWTRHHSNPMPTMRPWITTRITRSSARG